jgi:hypothetical protein
MGDRGGNVLSDVIGGLGLPAGRHVCYHLAFRSLSSKVRDALNAVVPHPFTIAPASAKIRL